MSAGIHSGILFTIAFGWYAISVGRQTGSPVLVAEGRHRQTDVPFKKVGLNCQKLYLGKTLFFTKCNKKGYNHLKFDIRKITN